MGKDGHASDIEFLGGEDRKQTLLSEVKNGRQERTSRDTFSKVKLCLMLHHRLKVRMMLYLLRRNTG